MPTLQPVELIASKILVIRGHRVMIDADLAELYGVPTKALNQAVKRNPARFPDDFMFQLMADEKQEVVTHCDHLSKLKFSSALPFAFTEHGAIQAANVLSSPQAADVGVYIVRAFVRLRELLASNKQLAQRLDELEQRIETGNARPSHYRFDQDPAADDDASPISRRRGDRSLALPPSLFHPAERIRTTTHRHGQVTVTFPQWLRFTAWSARSTTDGLMRPTR